MPLMPWWQTAKLESGRDTSERGGKPPENTDWKNDTRGIAAMAAPVASARQKKNRLIMSAIKETSSIKMPTFTVLQGVMEPAGES